MANLEGFKVKALFIFLRFVFHNGDTSSRFSQSHIWKKPHHTTHCCTLSKSGYPIFSSPPFSRAPSILIALVPLYVSKYSPKSLWADYRKCARKRRKRVNKKIHTLRAPFIIPFLVYKIIHIILHSKIYGNKNIHKICKKTVATSKKPLDNVIKSGEEAWS